MQGYVQVGQIFEFIKWELCLDHFPSWLAAGQGVSIRILLFG